MNTAKQLAKKLGLENVRTAGNLLGHYFTEFVNKTETNLPGYLTLNDFFDGRNRDDWTRSFAEFLKSKIDPDFPSND